VRRWIDDLGLTEDRIIETATETRRDHPAPADGPKALNRAMERAAKRDEQVAAASSKAPTGKRQPKRIEGARPSPDELAAFYADSCRAVSSRQSGCGRGVCIDRCGVLTKAA